MRQLVLLGLAAAAAAGAIAGSPLGTGAGATTDRPVHEPRPAVTCFTADAPEEVVLRWRAIDAASRGWERFFESGFTWPSHTPGTGIAFTYSFAPDGVTFEIDADGPGGNPPLQVTNNLHATMTEFEAHGVYQEWEDLFTKTFERFSQLTGNTYQEKPWGTGSGPYHFNIYGGDLQEPGVLGRNELPPYGNMYLNTGESALVQSLSIPGHVYFRNIVAHEHGHGLGFEHSCPDDGTKLMEPFNTDAFDGPQLDDIRGFQRRYGDALESNDNWFTAVKINDAKWRPSRRLSWLINPLNIDHGQTVNGGTKDEDWFYFTLDTWDQTKLPIPPEPEEFVLVVGRRGTPYENWPQGGQQSGCPTGSDVDDPRRLNLAIEVRFGNPYVDLGGSPLPQTAPGCYTIVDDTPGGERFYFASNGLISEAQGTPCGTPTLGSAIFFRVFVPDKDEADEEQGYTLRVLRAEEYFDLNGDGLVGPPDIGPLLGAMGTSAPEELDLTGDGLVDGADVARLVEWMTR